MSRLTGPRRGRYGGARRRGRPRALYVWLALLTFCAVFAATAGAREALAARTQALRQTLATAPSLDTAITVTGSWDDMATALAGANPGSVPLTRFAEPQLTEVTGQLRADFNQGVVSLAPTAADWASITSGLSAVQTPLPGIAGMQAKWEVSYRQPLSQHLRLVTGRFPASSPPPASASHGKVTSPAAAGQSPPLQIAVTEQTAARFGLHVGSTVAITGPESAQTGGLSTITLQVSGIVTPIDPASSFWTADQALVAPVLQCQFCRTPPFWVSGVITGPGEATAMLRDFGRSELALQWTLPMTLSSIEGQQAQALSDALTSLGTQPPALSGDVAPLSATLTASSHLLTTLSTFIAAAQSVDTLLWLLYVSLTAAGGAVLLLAARMVVLRRSGELAVLRARGSSLWQLARSTAAGAALACVPAAAAAAALAILVVPGAGFAQGAGSAGGWWPPAAVLLVAVCGPVLMVTWQYRPPRRRALGRRQPRARIRLVAEATLVAAAVAGIVVFRQQATQAGAGVNLYTSAAPLLVAIPAVIVVERVYPLVLRGLLHFSARTSGAPAFLGLARAARTALTPALPALALVLALTVAAFAGMVRDAVSNGEVAASWQAAGADVTVTAAQADFAIPAPSVRAISSVPGVTHSAGVWQAGWSTPNGTMVTVLVVDPVSYAALVAATQGFPQVRPGALAVPSTAGAVQPVLASPGAVASLGGGAVTLSTQASARPVKVRVAGVLSATPAWPVGGAFVVMPLAAIRSTATPPLPAPINELLLMGSGIDRARLAAVLRGFPAGTSTTFRSDILAGLTGAPLQHGAFVLLALALAVAAGLGLAVMLFELALGAAEREASLARLAVMGLGEGQRARMVALEVLPAVIAAAVAAWAADLVLPRVVAPAIDLSVFTGSSAGVPLVPDIASIALPLAGLGVLAAVSLGAEIWSGRQRSVATSLRAGG